MIDQKTFVLVKLLTWYIYKYEQKFPELPLEVTVKCKHINNSNVYYLVSNDLEKAQNKSVVKIDLADFFSKEVFNSILIQCSEEERKMMKDKEAYLLNSDDAIYYNVYVTLMRQLYKNHEPLFYTYIYNELVKFADEVKISPITVDKNKEVDELLTIIKETKEFVSQLKIDDSFDLIKIILGGTI